VGLLVADVSQQVSPVHVFPPTVVGPTLGLALAGTRALDNGPGPTFAYQGQTLSPFNALCLMRLSGALTMWYAG